ncbi:unnamed protein product [Merluccius merluccius]
MWGSRKPTGRLQVMGHRTHDLSSDLRDGGLLCSRCNRVLDENISISMDCPPMVCHEDCFTVRPDVCGAVLLTHICLLTQ